MPTLGSICGQQRLYFGVIKPCQTQIEACDLQIRQLKRQQFTVPTRPFRQLVLGQDEGALLRLRQVCQLDHWDVRHLQLACRQYPSMARHHTVMTIDQDGAVEAELPDAGPEPC